MNKKSLRVVEFRDSYVLYMFYRYEHYMSTSHMALIGAIVHNNDENMQNNSTELHWKNR